MPENKFVTPEVNLLPSDDLEEKPGGKFLKWSLSWGKKIVVLTELLVVLAFLSRFKLDSDVANLSEEVDHRKTIILASSDFEKQFRSVTARVNSAKKIDQSSSPIDVYDKAYRLIPFDVTISLISAKASSVTFQGQGEDQSLTSMVAAFKSSPDFDQVYIEHVKKQTGITGVNFIFTATYNIKPSETKKTL